ncbi:MAG TPA: hypothetical protein VGN17_09185 [Bryobacteraceae bacterium]|jgi:hypothetical protein
MGIRLLMAWAALGSVAWGADLFVGTWKLRAPETPLVSSMLQITSGLTHKLTYKMTYTAASGINPVTEMFVTSLDGKDSTATLGNGAPAPVKMAITRIDDRHWTAAVKTGGQVSSTSKVEVSEDGKVLKIESSAKLPNGKTLPGTQYWDRQ